MPQRLGRYAVRRRIGSGGFATVWLAYDEQLDSPVAVKVLADNWTEDAQVRRRFLEEGRYLRRVESPHVVTVYDAGELDDGRPYLVMSYADQGTLADRLEVEGLSVAQAMEVIRQVGTGLQALHDHDILHRDIKPANVLFRTAHGEVRTMVGDLGLGKALDVSSRLTMIAGTPSYVAPEQAQAENPDARADQYSLAALSYLLLAGRAPYAHANLQAAAHPEAPAPLSTDERPFPDAVDAVVRRGLAVDREDRYDHVLAYVDALDAALDVASAGSVAAPWLPIDPELTQPGNRPSLHTPGDALPDPVRPRRSRLRAVLAGAGCLAVLAGASAGGYAWQQSRPEPDVTITDTAGSLSVRVPADWDRARSGAGWRAPSDQADYPALSVGTTPTWTDAESTGEGVFLGILPDAGLPSLLPQHPECAEAREPVSDLGTEASGQVSTTIVHTGCPGGVTVERVVQVASNRVLWVQVRSRDTATANRVLDSVRTYGF
ncbi:unannotated protein [freshwater metagenome]|uniref:Unannotated protein n=1 Tax=freshwater metagenome TaxID=449393 RepID=A0A6J6QQ39_9ZZZZ